MTRALRLGKNLKSQLEVLCPQIDDVVLYVNSSCNLRCKHCYIGNELLDSNNVVDSSDLCEFIREFSSLSCITILGGEPLLHRGINDVLQAALDVPIGDRRITTNLTEFFFFDHKRFVGRPFTLAVSLDGADSVSHDFIRGSGMFDKTVRNLRTVVEEGFDIEVSHTITRRNISAFEELIALCKSLRVRKLNLHKVSLQGNAQSNAEPGCRAIGLGGVLPADREFGADDGRVSAIVARAISANVRN